MKIINSLTCDSIEAPLGILQSSIIWLSYLDDTKEGIAPFIEKTKPNFKGR